MNRARLAPAAAVVATVKGRFCKCSSEPLRLDTLFCFLPGYLLGIYLFNTKYVKPASWFFLTIIRRHRVFFYALATRAPRKILLKTWGLLVVSCTARSYSFFSHDFIMCSSWPLGSIFSHDPLLIFTTFPYVTIKMLLHFSAYFLVMFSAQYINWKNF